MSKKTLEYTQWTAFGPREYLACSPTIPTLQPGLYQIASYNHQPIFVLMDLKADHLFQIPDTVSDDLLQEIQDFWASKEIFDRFGFLHRRGYLLYGPAGSGKSSTVQQIIRHVISLEGVAFQCQSPHLFSRGLSIFRQVEPERPVVCVFEDIDAIARPHREFGEEDLLTLLDGENQIDYVLSIATTNYPELLDRRIVSRPRRFDRLVRIDMPSPSMRQAYLRSKLSDVSEQELEKWVEATEEFSFASLAECIISVKCLGKCGDGLFISDFIVT